MRASISGRARSLLVKKFALNRGDLTYYLFFRFLEDSQYSTRHHSVVLCKGKQIAHGRYVACAV
jgi:hypothetical protein